MSTRKITNILTLLLALAGGAVALILTYQHFNPEALGCSKDTTGCGGVLGSSYAKLGPIPTALFGLGMYALLIVLSVLRQKRLGALSGAEAARAAAYATAGATEEVAEGDAAEAAPQSDGPTVSAMDATGEAVQQERAALDRLNLAVFAFAVSGVVVSWWLQYTALYVIGALCPWCFSSACIITLIGLLAARDYLLDGKKLNGEQKLLAGTLAFIGVMSAILVMPNVREQMIRLRMKEVMDSRKTQTVPVMRERILGEDPHIKGDPNAPHTIVEFADYQCAACRRASAGIEELLEKYKGKVKAAYRNYPLPMHQWGGAAAFAAEAANLQGKFWEMNALIFSKQSMMEMPTFTAAEFENMARSLNLDVERFKQDMASDTVRRRVTKDRADADAGGLTMTPTFFFVSGNPKTKVWRFSGLDALTKAMDNPDHEMWK